jgi:hypothetical protein
LPRPGEIFGFVAGEDNAVRFSIKGGIPVVDGEGFFVKGGKGPLKDGETERAES